MARERETLHASTTGCVVGTSPETVRLVVANAAQGIDSAQKLTSEAIGAGTVARSVGRPSVGATLLGSLQKDTTAS